MSYSIKKYLINLDHRADRLNDFLESYNQAGFYDTPITRVSGILDKDFGGLGCAKSHLSALTDFITNSQDDYCLIFEDDFLFKSTKQDLEKNVDTLAACLPNFKVFLLAGTYVIKNNHNSNKNITEIFESQSTSGYLVNRCFIPSLMKNICNSIIKMENYRHAHKREVIYSRFSIDQTWKRLQHEGGWYGTFPMSGIQAASFSDIENKLVDYVDASS